MIRTSRFVIPVAPMAWQRARVNATGLKPRFFDGQSQDKLVFALALENQHGNAPLFTHAVHIDLTFFMYIPKNKKRASEYHACTPDLDNLIKFILDSMNNVILADDKLVSSLTARKIYDPRPRTEMIITSLLEE